MAPRSVGRRAGIKLLAKNGHFCEGCALGKATDELGKEAPEQGNKPFDFIRVDLAMHKNPSHLGYKYSLHIVDVWSNYHWVKFLRTKDEGLNVLRDWVEMIHNQTGHWARIIGADGGTELGQTSKPFLDDQFKAWTRTKGIIVFQTTPNTPWMNGKIERAAGEVLEKTRAHNLWWETPRNGQNW